MANPGLLELSQRGISRRQLFRGLGYGVAGTAIASLLRPKPADASPVTISSAGEVVFNAPIDPTGNTAAVGDAYYINGMMYLQVVVTQNGDARYDLLFIDVHDQQIALRLQDFFNFTDLPQTPYQAPVSDGKTVYAVNGPTIYNIDVNGGVVETWPTFPAGANATSNPILHNGNLIFLTSDGSLTSFNLSTQQMNWSSTIAAGNGVISAKGSNIYVVAQGAFTPVDADTGNNTWENAVPPGNFALSADKVIIAGSDNVLRSYDTVTGNPVWSYPTSGALSAPLVGPVYYNGQILLADGAGILHIIDEIAGQQVSQVSIPGTPNASSGLFLEDGIVYLALGGSGALVIWAYDLTEQQAITFTSSSAGAFMGVQNGVCYFTHNQGAGVMGVNFTGHAHGLSSESCLIEDYLDSTSSKTPTYRTQLLFLDSNYNPRPNNSVKIWSSDPATIIYGSVSYNIDSTTPVWLRTDGAGEMSIVISPDDIRCPALYVWDTYMYTGEAVLIYPDAATSNTLSNVQANNMTTAQDYSGATLLSPGYNGADSLASGIRSSMNGSSSVSINALKQRLANDLKNSARTKALINGARRFSASTTYGDTYIAYPNSAPNMVYFPNSAADPSRPYVPANPTDWTLQLSSDGACYNCSNFSASTSSAVKISWRDLEKKVVHGAENVVHVAAHVAEQVVHTITTDVNNVYTVVIDSVEAAFAVVASTLKSVIGDIKRAIEWLSYLFNWHDMLQTMNTIVTTVNTRLQNFNSWIDGVVQKDIAAVHTFFATLEQEIVDNINTVIGQIGGNTVQSQQVDNNNPSALYGPNGPGKTTGGQSYSQSRWMTSKVNDNAPQATVVSSPSLSASEDITSIVQSLYQSIGQTLSDPKFQDLPSQLQNAGKSFGALFEDPNNFVAHSISDFLTIVGNIAVGLVQLLDAIIETLLQQFTTLMNYGMQLITAELKIPVIDKLWSDIGAGSLTMLNVMALASAIPATIISKLVGVESLPPQHQPPHQPHQPRANANAAAGSADSLLAYCTIFSGAIYGTLDGISILEDLSTTQSRVLLAETFILFFLGIPFDTVPSDVVLGTLFYMASGLSIIESVCTYAVNANKNESFKSFQETYNHQVTGIDFCFGTFMLGLSAAAGLSDSKDFGGYTLLGNIFGYLPYVATAFAAGPPESPLRIAVALIDGVSDFMSASMSALAELG